MSKLYLPLDDPPRQTSSFRYFFLGDEGGRGAGLVLPGGREDGPGLVVPGQTVDPRLDENEAELCVPVLSVALQVLADAHRLLDEVVDVLGDVGREALGLEDAEDLVAGDEADLGDSVAITEDDSDLGGGQALLRQLEDLGGAIHQLFNSILQF
jgi:hypothetical protein